MNLNNHHDQEGIEKEIKFLISKYAQSVYQASDPTLASQIWSKSPEASFIHPRGHEHGWEEIKGIFMRIQWVIGSPNGD